MKERCGYSVITLGNHEISKYFLQHCLKIIDTDQIFRKTNSEDCKRKDRQDTERRMQTTIQRLYGTSYEFYVSFC